MAKVTLFSAPLPKGAGGRKPQEIDSDLYDALLSAIQENPVTQVDGEDRPTTFGDAKRLFDTEGKASSDGRRYAKPLADKLEKTVRVRVVESAEGSGKFGWVVYVPLNEPAPKPAE